MRQSDSGFNKLMILIKGYDTINCPWLPFSFFVDFLKKNMYMLVSETEIEINIWQTF